MKIPKYLKIIPSGTGKRSITFTVKVKWWGWPILIFKAMRERFVFPWYSWLAYPYFCVKIMRNACREVR
ncbi:hypothetical protein SAMN02745168_0638 [Papillibacter cinnamivorans DSM 12816]|uniref:Uncharacterized protein n=1 Tax=Papillibacter cinnamivorans DSM 12816 TaxID=1122930 RepID=A0A1W1YR30_9FIRM|nr:hypothetical protein SAMN02745168_0638 [Papillibacter cinnamivorans DSM 12816]